MTLVFALAILFVAALGQTVFGFGGGLISIPLLSLTIGIREGVTLALILQLSTAPLVLKSLHQLRSDVLMPMLVGVPLGTILGTCLLGGTSESYLRMILAVFLLLYLVKSLFYDRARAAVVTGKAGGIAAGLGAGFIQGLIGCGGPLMVIYLRETAQEKEPMRACLLLLLLASNCVRLAVSVPTGLLTPFVLKVSTASIPLLLIAMYVGGRLHHGLSEKSYHAAIRAVLFASLVSLVWKNL